MASTTSFERKGLRFGMESSPASAEVKGSRQSEEKRDREKRRKKKKTEKGGEEEVGVRVKTTREGEHAETQMLAQRGSSLPAHAVATGSPVEPDCMEGWKVDCRSNRSLCIFTALHGGKKKKRWFHPVTLFVQKPEKQ